MGARSLRLRLTLWYAAALAACLALYGGAVYWVLLRHLYAEMDLHLHEDAEEAANRVEAAPDGTLAWRGGEALAQAEEEPGGGRWIEVWSADRRLLLAGSSASPSALGQLPPLEQGERLRSRTLSSGIRVRTLAKTATVVGRPVVIRAGRSEEPVRQQLRHLLAGLGFVFPLAVAVFGLMGYGLVRRLLSPLADMADRAKRITAERLGDRLPVEYPDDEMGRLATAFNETFARLEHSFDQLHRFTADASHELRTPLTALRSVGEVGLKGTRDVEGYREVIGSMLEETDRLTRLVDALLVLARADAGESKLAAEDVDLSALAEDVCDQLAVLAEERGQSLSLDAPETVRVHGDRLLLRHALVNLVDNAIKYGPEASVVRVSVRRRNGACVVEVVDRGPGVPAAHRERIFDRFYRVDKGRSREVGGAGLGLALVKWAAEAHGGRVGLESRDGEGSTFRIILPSSVDPPPGGP